MVGGRSHGRNLAGFWWPWFAATTPPTLKPFLRLGLFPTPTALRTRFDCTSSRSVGKGVTVFLGSVGPSPPKVGDSSSLGLENVLPNISPSWWFFLVGFLCSGAIWTKGRSGILVCSECLAESTRLPIWNCLLSPGRSVMVTSVRDVLCRAA